MLRNLKAEINKNQQPEKQQAEFWERWYSLTGDYHFGPAVTEYRDPNINKANRQKSQVVYHKYQNASDEELKQYRQDHPYYPCH